MGKVTHGEGSERLGRSPEYLTWRGIKARCLFPCSTKNKDYGGRGISVCKRWAKSFQAFLKDMGRKPGPDYEIDRIDLNGNYSPSNCRWLIRSENRKHKRNSIKLTLNGATKTQAEWSRELGINKSTIYDRRKSGWSDFHCLSVKPKVGQKLHWNGKLL